MPRAPAPADAGAGASFYARDWPALTGCSHRVRAAPAAVPSAGFGAIRPHPGPLRAQRAGMRPDGAEAR